MKAKHLIIVSLLLAIITMGVVSASEDVAVDDAMATSDVTENPIEEAPVDEVIEQSEDSEPLADYSPDDFNYNAKKSIDLDDEDKVVFNCTLPEEGYINYYVNDEYVSFNVGSSSDLIQIDINDLEIDEPSTYKVKFVFEPSSSQDEFVITEYNLTVTKTYHVSDFDPEWNDDITSKFEDVLDIYSPTKGTLIVAVKGDKRFNVTADESDSISVHLSDLNITSNGQYTVSAKFIVNATSQEVDLGEKTIDVDVDNWDADEYVSIINNNINILEHGEEIADVSDNVGYLNGTVTVEIDGVEKLSKVFTEDDYKSEFEITVDDLKLYNNITEGEHTVKVVYMKNGIDKHEVTKSVEFYASDEYVSIYGPVDILDHDSTLVAFEDYTDNLNGTISVYIDGVPKFTKNIAASEQKDEFSVTVDDLNLYNNIAYGNHKVKAVYMRNGVDKHEIEKSVVFYTEPDFKYSDSLSVGEKETLVISYIETFTGTATLYNAKWESGDLVKGTVAGSAKFSNGVATIPFGSLSKGDHYFLLNITGYPYERQIEVYVSENTPGLSASVSASEITVGSSVVVKFNSPKSDNKVYINVDGLNYASVIASGAVSQEIKGLTAGTHKIKVFFEDEGKFYSNTFYVTVKNPTPAKKDTIKLTLKKVKVKKSAKKLVLQATLKINGKAVKGKVIKFKFNKKTYKAKTNKKGVAKVTVKKNILKKLKVGKKVKIQATYNKTTKKLTVKVKK